MAVKWGSARNTLSFARNLLTNWALLSLNRWWEIPYEISGWSRNIFATCVAVFSDEGFSLFIFQHRCVITFSIRFSFFVRGSVPTMSISIRFSFFVCGSGPTISIAIHYRGPDVDYSFKVVFVLIVCNWACILHIALPLGTFFWPCVAFGTLFALCRLCAAHLSIQQLVDNASHKKCALWAVPGAQCVGGRRYSLLGLRVCWKNVEFRCIHSDLRCNVAIITRLLSVGLWIFQLLFLCLSKFGFLLVVVQ